jgi:hypothetical protein
LALTELARSDARVAEIFDGVRSRERAVVAERTGPDIDPGSLDLVMATVEGLRVGLCDAGGILPLAEARSTLTRLLELLGHGAAATRPA